ncbi:unnamed protein product [Adineta ricciae]|uniref:Uncharacterized protein n=1 Tax=Adineta ricciae TaxID=249248 RepID=A0A815WE71_ADIRI|nr:unnamed protein product [Adineta ricciae]
MNNVTIELPESVNIFHRYLLGESLKNSLIRLTVILSVIILVWLGMLLALIIHLKCQRSRQRLKSSTSHHLHESDKEPVRKCSEQFGRSRRFDSSVSSISSIRCHSLRRNCFRLKRFCFFWSSSTNDNEQPDKRSSISGNQRDAIRVNPIVTPIRLQVTLANTVKRPSANVGLKLSSYHDISSSSGEELKNLCAIEDEHDKQIMSANATQSFQQNHLASSSFPDTMAQTNLICPTPERLQKLHEFNTKATLLFHPITRRLSNANTNNCLLPLNTIQNQQRKSLLAVSSTRELTSTNQWHWKHSLINNPIHHDERVTSSARQLPLVMITDTNSSNTNIVELETYEDNHRLMTELDKRLARQLRSSYRPRHST